MSIENAYWERYDKIKFGTVNGVFAQKEKYLIIGLTGKVGAGCSTIAEIFQRTLEQMSLSYNQPGLDGLKNDKEREYRVLQRFFKWHQKPFHLIKVRDVILSFILEDEKSWNQFLQDAEAKKKGLKDKLTKEIDNWDKSIENINKPEGDRFERNQKCWGRISEKEAEFRFRYVKEYLPRLGKRIHDILEDQYTELFQDYGNRLRFFGTITSEKFEKAVDEKAKCAESRKGYFERRQPLDAEYFKQETQTNTMYSIAERINRFIKALEYPQSLNDKHPVAVVIDSIKNIYESNYLKDRYTAYYLISASRDEQLRMQQLRRKKLSYSQERLNFIDLNERPNYARKKLRGFARQCSLAYGDILAEKKFEDVKACINDIAAGDEDAVLGRIVAETEPYQDELKEFLNTIQKDGNPGLEFFHEAGISKALHAYYCYILKDLLRVYLYLSGLYSFYLQDVENCIQNADIFLTNNERTEEKQRLCQNVVRYLSLMMHPGLVPPTPVERCMQIAYTAKVNSGCISRQVGAVVTDAEYQILSLSWNDVPCGQTPCILRNLIDVSRGIDPIAYSDYECSEYSEFKEFTKQYRFEQKEVELRLGGLPVCFCFKDLNGALLGERNPMESRAMHGEEKALLLCDQRRARGGYLFTTSSPCIMCAKNAKEHQIKKIYYIEPYPGISQSHVCNSGSPDNRAQYELFEGAIGRAYTQLYTPIIPYKDELEMRGVPAQFQQDVEKKSQNGNSKEETKTLEVVGEYFQKI